MPDRIIRDELLTSERYWSVSPEARNLFVGIVLSADDAARYAGSNFALRTRCMGGTVSPDRLEQLLQELAVADLVRPYEHQGMRYLYVPRFRQRRRYVKSSLYPDPPKQIIELTLKKSDSGQTQARPESDRSQTQDRRSGVEVGVGVGVGVGVEEKRSEKTAVDVRPTVDARASLRSTASDIQSQTFDPKSDEAREFGRTAIAKIHEQMRTRQPIKPMPPPEANVDDPTPEQIEAREREKRRQVAAAKQASKAPTPGAPDPPPPPPKPKAPKPKPNGAAAWNPATDAEVLAKAHELAVPYPAGSTYAQIKALVRAHMKAHP